MYPVFTLCGISRKFMPRVWKGLNSSSWMFREDKLTNWVYIEHFSLKIKVFWTKLFMREVGNRIVNCNPGRYLHQSSSNENTNWLIIPLPKQFWFSCRLSVTYSAHHKVNFFFRLRITKKVRVKVVVRVRVNVGIRSLTQTLLIVSNKGVRRDCSGK